MPSLPPLDPEQLRAARVRAGLTQSQLARAIGVAGGERVSKWELGEAVPSAAVRARLARALGLEVEDLLPKDGVSDLRRLRLQAGLTVAQLAKRGEVSAGTIKRWESGAMTRTHAPLDRLASALGVDEARVREALARPRAGER